MFTSSIIGLPPLPLPPPAVVPARCAGGALSRRPALYALEHRSLGARNLWASRQCLQVVVEMDRFADALTTDLPGFSQALLASFPSFGAFAAPMHGGCFISEVLGQLAMELQRLDGSVPSAATVATVRGRDNQVTITIACAQQAAALQAFDMALSVVDALAREWDLHHKAQLPAARSTRRHIAAETGRFHADGNRWQRRGELHQRPPAADIVMS